MFGFGRIRDSLVARLLAQIVVILVLLAAGSTVLFWYGVTRWNQRLYARYNERALARFEEAWRGAVGDFITQLVGTYDFRYGLALQEASSPEEAASRMREWLRVRLHSARDVVERMLVYWPDGTLEVAFGHRVLLNHLVFEPSRTLDEPYDLMADRLIRNGRLGRYGLLGWYPLRGDFVYWYLLRYGEPGENEPGARIFAILLSLRKTMRDAASRLSLRAPQGLLIVRKDGVIIYSTQARWTNQHCSRLFPGWRELEECADCGCSIVLRTRTGESWLLTCSRFFEGDMRSTVAVYTNLSAFEAGLIRKILVAHVFLSILALGGTILVVSSRTRRVLSTLSHLTREAERIAVGQWGGEVEVDGRDEVSRLAQSFNKMSRSLAHLVDQVVRERGAKREQEQISQMRAMMLQVLGHDLNKLLTALRGPLENLMVGTYGTCPERAVRPLRRALVAVRLMEDMVLNILASARIERGQVQLELSRFRERELMTELRAYIEALEERWRREDITIRVEDGAADVRMVADREKLVRVLVNLVTNGVESVRRSGKEVGQVVVRSLAKGFDVLFEVSDNGEGMNPEQVKAWLEDLREISPSEAMGLGLGLNIVKTFVRLHGGEIRVRTEEGVGTTFQLRIPRIVGEEG